MKKTTTADRIRLVLALISVPCLFLAAITAGVADARAVELVPSGSTWKFLDDGSDQGSSWIGPSFDDTLWASGPAQLGYGDYDEATTVSFGTDPDLRHITTYFRHAFSVANPGDHPALYLGLLRDDGAVVYLNGTEVARSNMSVGPIAHTTLASDPALIGSENAWLWFTADPALLTMGINVLAVEIHKHDQTNNDLSFDLQLNDDQASMVNRGPYLQLGTPSAVTLRWRTIDATDSRVSYGLTPSNLNLVEDDPLSTLEHEVRLTGLQPGTRYYYSVGTTGETYVGGDTEHFFQTSPVVGAELPVRVWLLGDSGTGDANAAAVRDAYYAFTGATHTDLVLMLGDNAYPYGSDDENQGAVFGMFSEMLRKTVLWSTRGNHETLTDVYYGQFTFPTAGEAGGLPSGTEAYYSFDHANIHFICLDSEGTSLDLGSPMLTWLAGDLAATTQTWIVAFWHHPPYSKGSHDSDIVLKQIQVRQNVLPILEAGGVDLVFSGHSHVYERSFLLDGHYDYSWTLDPSMVLDGGDGRLDGTGAYTKTTAPRDGTVYCVAGSSSLNGTGDLNHPAMFMSLSSLGSVALDVSGNRLDLQFIDSSGVVGDYFTLFTEQAPPGTVGASYTCVPASGTLPFSTSMSAALQNLYTGTTRTIAAAIELDLASGQHFASWRTGFTNVAAGGQFATSWVQSLPAVGTLVGLNTFTMRAMDVTPAPFNQPPHPPSGDMATAGCTVTGTAR